MPGVTGPLATKAPIDFVVVREGTEGPYVGAGGTLAEGTDAEIATEESLNTRRGAERVIRDAFERASKRERKKLTLVHKNNVLPVPVDYGLAHLMKLLRSFQVSLPITSMLMPLPCSL